MIKYCITTIQDDMRMMLHPHNAYGTHETERDARDHLVAMVSNNHNQAISEILGDCSTVKIMPVDCYAGGDPKQVIF